MSIPKRRIKNTDGLYAVFHRGLNIYIKKDNGFWFNYETASEVREFQADQVEKIDAAFKKAKGDKSTWLDEPRPEMVYIVQLVIH